jgi:hypothetical protein
LTDRAPRRSGRPRSWGGPGREKKRKEGINKTGTSEKRKKKTERKNKDEQKDKKRSITTHPEGDKRLCENREREKEKKKKDKIRTK